MITIKRNDFNDGFIVSFKHVRLKQKVESVKEIPILILHYYGLPHNQHECPICIAAKE